MTKEERRARALAWLRQALPEPPPCLNCGRVMLAGRCCEKPRFKGHDYDDAGQHRDDCAKCKGK